MNDPLLNYPNFCRLFQIEMSPIIIIISHFRLTLQLPQRFKLLSSCYFLILIKEKINLLGILNTFFMCF